MSLTFTWTAEPGAASYLMEILDPVTRAVALSFTVASPTKTLSPSNRASLTAGGSYYWRVTATHTDGTTLSTDTWRFAVGGGSVSGYGHATSLDSRSASGYGHAASSFDSKSVSGYGHI